MSRVELLANADADADKYGVEPSTNERPAGSMGPKSTSLIGAFDQRSLIQAPAGHVCLLEILADAEIPRYTAI